MAAWLRHSDEEGAYRRGGARPSTKTTAQRRTTLSPAFVEPNEVLKVVAPPPLAKSCSPTPTTSLQSHPPAGEGDVVQIRGSRVPFFSSPMHQQQHRLLYRRATARAFCSNPPPARH